MNQLRGIITDIEVENHLSMVRIKVYDEYMTSIVLDAPDQASYLKKGQTVSVLFKENEVIIAKLPLPSISVRNKLLCKVTHIQKGKLLSRLVLSCHSNELVSVISTKSVDDMEIKAGDEVVALIKTNEVMLAR